MSSSKKFAAITSAGTSKSPRKGKAGTSPRKKARTGTFVPAAALPRKLFNWENLPYDVQAMIYDQLAPLDLVMFSRVNKNMHRFLQAPASRLHWRAARARIDGLPQCPEWLSELQYASLCFEDRCQNCLETDYGSVSPLWEFYKRYCSECKTLNVSSLQPFDGVPDGSYKTLFNGKVEDIFPCIFRQIFVDGNFVRTPFFHCPEVGSFRDAVMEAGEADRARIVLARQAATQLRREHARRCAQWESKVRKIERQRIEQVKTDRLHDIYDSLVGLGFRGEMLNLGVKLRGLPNHLRELVQKPVPLTTSEWGSISPMFVSLLQERKTLDARHVLAEAMLFRLKRLDSVLKTNRPVADDTWPAARDLTDISTVAHLIQVHHEVYIPESTYMAIVTEQVLPWRAQRENALLALLPGLNVGELQVNSCGSRITRSKAPPLPPLSRKAALFWCVACDQLISGTTAMYHRCCYEYVDNWASVHPPCCRPWFDGVYSPLVLGNEDIFKKISIVQARGLGAWSAGPLHGCTDIIHAIWAGCGLDIGAQESCRKADDIRVACNLCCIQGKVVVAMGWRRAVHHTFEVHAGIEVQWKQVCGEIAAKVKQLEFGVRDYTIEKTQALARYSCRLCPWPHKRISMMFDELQGHFEHCHGEFASPESDCELSPDSPDFLPPASAIYESSLSFAEFSDISDELHALPDDTCIAPMHLPQKWFKGRI
ncbi:hypothetical protein C8Q74DRAFT_1373474 [Fomes fomentarius]|nr:hypothetical protein C8Q74DRAFT_1373474 [Fomes fomentarius]